jgi:hypothetical protein
MASWAQACNVAMYLNVCNKEKREHQPMLQVEEQIISK